jgi:hypothetical protein
MQAAVGEFHLGFDADRRADAPAIGALDHEVQQRALARAGFAAQDDGAATTVTCLRQDGVQEVAFPAPPNQPDRPPIHRLSL